MLTSAVVAMTMISAHANLPPGAEKHPVVMTLHGDTRVDEFAWLRDKANPKVIEYLESENTHAKDALAHTESLQQTLYDEFIGRIKQTDLSVPYAHGPYFYYSRTVEGLDYSIQCRKRGHVESEEEIYLDLNELARDQVYFRVTRQVVSPDHTKLAYCIDLTGYETVDLFIKDLNTGETTGPVLTGLAPWSLVWGNDNRTLFYGRTDESKRTNRIYRHVLGTSADQDELLIQEDDVKFSVGVSRTRSDGVILISSSSSTTSEVWIIDAETPAAAPTCVAPRRQGIRYSLEHRPGIFYIRTDEDAPNFRIMTAPEDTPGHDHWTEFIPHDPEVYITGVNAFADHLVLSERRGGYTALHVKDLRAGSDHLIDLPEEVGTVYGATNRQFDTDTFRYRFSSLVTPMSVYDYDVRSRDRVLRKQDEIKGYDREKYETLRAWATAPDGTRIPISIVHRRGVKKDGANPCLLYGYGSYGSSMDPAFRSTIVSLLDRGFVYAIGHVRGGAEMGRHWKEQGRMLHKKNTFTDFIACAEHLIDAGYTRTDRLAIKGGSAGGLLIGAVINMRPDLFAAAHAAVPFVDVVNTMLDASIPLTTGEYEEWGNPIDPEYYTYIKSYSPYDNVTAQAYPDLLITAGLNDPRVHYWEPAKWCARLRDRRTSDNMLIMKTNMGAGHGGASGRYGRYRETAFEYAFVVDRVGIPSGE